jgi:hypothetical protein
MADEFIKGLGIFTAGGLAWLTLASWYRTPGFESTEQLVAPITVSGDNIFDALGILLMDVFFWFTLIGAFTFWVAIPAGREIRKAIENRRTE